MRKLKNYKPTRFMSDDSRYDKKKADYAVNFIECLTHTKGTWAGRKFELIDWQEQYDILCNLNNFRLIRGHDIFQKAFHHLQVYQ